MEDTHTLLEWEQTTLTLTTGFPACARARVNVNGYQCRQSGLSVCSGFAGSRSGALIATAWASMVHLGEAGYMDATAKIMQVS